MKFEHIAFTQEWKKAIDAKETIGQLAVRLELTEAGIRWRRKKIEKLTGVKFPKLAVSKRQHAPDPELVKRILGL